MLAMYIHTYWDCMRKDIWCNASELATVIHARCSTFQIITDEVVKDSEGEYGPRFANGCWKQSGTEQLQIVIIGTQTATILNGEEVNSRYVHNRQIIRGGRRMKVQRDSIGVCPCLIIIGQGFIIAFMQWSLWVVWTGSCNIFFFLISFGTPMSIVTDTNYLVLPLHGPSSLTRLQTSWVVSFITGWTHLLCLTARRFQFLHPRSVISADLDIDLHRHLSALITLLLGQSFCARNLLASVFVMFWAVRLACMFNRVSFPRFVYWL